MSSLGDRRPILERQIALRRELLRRQAKQKQCKPGGLFEFVKYFWHILEPKTPFVDGWAIRAICEHLEAVTYGHINRLLANVPPGFSKSLLTNVFWPAWEQGPMNLPHLRTIAFSYASHLTERDNAKFRDLLRSNEYQALYGDRFKLTSEGVEKVANDKTGWRYASSVGGVGTGERADRVVCFPYDEMVQTELGPRQIGDLVRSRMRLRVLSLNRETGRAEYRRIVGWHTNPGSPLVRVRLSNGQSFRCTPDHRVLTATGSFVCASRLEPGDEVTSIRNGVVAGYAKPAPAVPYGGYGADRYAVLASQFTHGKSTAKDCFNLLSRQLGLGSLVFPTESAVEHGVSHVVGARSIFKIIKSTIGSVAIFMANLAALGARANECIQNQLVHEPILRFAGNPHGDARVTLVEDGAKNAARNREALTSLAARLVVPSDYARHAANAAQVGDFVSSRTDNRKPDLAVTSVEWCGHANETFCLEVEGNHNFTLSCCVVVRNCDDPHNIKDGESDTIRTKTVRWFDEAMSNRLNDLQKSAIVVIMQRVHENDVSGHIIENEPDYCHLMIPMEWDGRRYETTIGWTDPREEYGELAWAERYPEHTLTRFRRNAFLWAGQYQQSPEPRGGGIFKRDWWVYEEVPVGRSPPQMEYIVASLDSAYTKNERNDPSGFSVWGVYRDQNDNPKVLLLQAWRKHLEMHGPEVKRKIGESERLYIDRAKKEWGLVEWVAYECRRLRVDRLLIEAKASGITVAQEMQRLYADDGWGVELIDPEGDKYFRAMAVVHLWADGFVHVPASRSDPDDPDSLVPRDFAQTLIDEAAIFPNGRFRDITDSATQALKHLRAIGMAVRRDEREEQRMAQMKHTQKLPPLYHA